MSYAENQPHDDEPTASVARTNDDERRVRKVAVIVNPASGRDAPILAPLNRALARGEIEWEVFVLHQDGEGDALHAALQTSPDVLLVYGGDGTMARIAAALLNSDRPDTPLGSLGGGTANALAETLAVPKELEDAVDAICEGRFRIEPSDVGMVGNDVFLLRASIGATAGLTSHTTRDEKDRLGLLAYALSGLRALSDAEPQRYAIIADGKRIEVDAVSVIVANAPGTGLGAPILSDVEQQDGMLDVVIVPSASWLATAAANAAIGDGLLDGAEHFRVRRVRVESAKPMTVHLDGEDIGVTPVEAVVRPKALRLVNYRS
jgi:YegS/Rv2252/BmrU family lipid kinase